MEGAGARCGAGGSRGADVVCEKRVFKGKLPEPLFQLACSHGHCAFPVSRNELCVWNAAAAQPLYLSGHHYSVSALSFGSKINPLLVCSASHERVIVWNLDECTQKVQEGFAPRGIVIGTLLGMVLHVRFSPDDEQVAVCAGNQIYMLSAKLWIFSVISEHNYHCVAHIDLKKEQEKFCNKVWKSGKEIGKGQNNSKLCKTDMRPEGSVETSLPILLIEHCDFFVCFHNEENTMTMFSPNTNLKKKEASKWKTSCKCKNKEYPLESYPPIKYEKEISVTCKPTPIFCVQYSGDGELLACGLADKTVLVFNSNLTDVHDVFSGKFNFNTKNCTDIVLTAGSNRALEVFDLNAGCSTAVIQEAHGRSVHQICQNKGSSFTTQQPEAYNLFLTTAVGDGIKLWDLRTLRCERRFEGHSSRCYPCGIAVSPCGRFIASGSDDKYVSIIFDSELSCAIKVQAIAYLDYYASDLTTTKLD
ncbi:WD repeat-containing protein 27 [Lonchura striata]|uniref:WD repeat-containing protein 27 n=1 Tax=Lonchura striata TaxID=40157 RepID=A0A218VBP1_9PASE|nr:WD repeat-containing protein 27 [Lonchura striata domestica]